MSFSISPNDKNLPVTPEFHPELTVDLLRDIESVSYVASYAEAVESNDNNKFGYLQKEVVLGMKGGGTVTLTDVQTAHPSDSNLYDDSNYSYALETGGYEFLTRESESFHISVDGYSKGIGGVIPDGVSQNIDDYAFSVEAELNDEQRANQITDVVDELREYFEHTSRQREHVMHVMPKLNVPVTRYNQEIMVSEPIKSYHNVSLDEVGKVVGGYLKENGLESEFALTVNKNGLIEASPEARSNFVIANIKGERFEGVDFDSSESVVRRMGDRNIGMKIDGAGKFVVQPISLPKDVVLQTVTDSQRNTIASSITPKLGHNLMVYELSDGTENSIRNKVDIDSPDYKMVGSVMKLKDELFNQIKYDGRPIVAVLSGEFDTVEGKQQLVEAIAEKKLADTQRKLPDINVVSNIDIGLGAEVHDQFYRSINESRVEVSNAVEASKTSELENTNSNTSLQRPTF